ncbi:MAG: hypothetical protein V3R45_06265 [Candidatus Aminicenantaceae bacterium]
MNVPRGKIPVNMIGEKGKNGGADETRTRDLRRDRLDNSCSRDAKLRPYPHFYLYPFLHSKIVYFNKHQIIIARADLTCPPKIFLSIIRPARDEKSPPRPPIPVLPTSCLVAPGPSA